MIDYKLHVRGIPLRWRSEITTWEPPGVDRGDEGNRARFVDVQRRGPYRKWEHEHLFESVSGGTHVTDRVTYSVPGGYLVERLLVGPDLRKIFAYRTRVMEQLLGAMPTTQVIEPKHESP